MLVVKKCRQRRYPDLSMLGRAVLRAWARRGPVQARLPYRVIRLRRCACCADVRRSRRGREDRSQEATGSPAPARRRCIHAFEEHRRRKISGAAVVTPSQECQYCGPVGPAADEVRRSWRKVSDGDDIPNQRSYSDGVFISVESTPDCSAVPVSCAMRGWVGGQETPIPPTPRNTLHCSVVSPLNPTC